MVQVLMPTNMKIKVGDFYWLSCDKAIEIKRIGSDAILVKVGEFTPTENKIITWKKGLYKLDIELLDSRDIYCSSLERLEEYIMNAFVL